MKEQTISLMKKFEDMTGVKPKSARLGVGSMKNYIYFRMEFTDEIHEYIRNFYNIDMQDRHIFRGKRGCIEVTFLNNVFEKEYHQTRGYVFIVDKKKLI